MKIFLETYDECYLDRVAFIDKIQAELSSNHGIIFVDDYSAADIIMSQQVAYNPRLDFCMNQKRDVIILEVNDTATIFNDNLRKAIKEKKIKGFFKVTNFKDRNCHNEPTSGDVRYHVNFINEKEKLCTKKPYETILSDSDLNKIKCGMPAFLNFRMDSVRSALGHKNDRREIHVNFAGTTDYSKNKNYINLSPDDPKLHLPKLMNIHRMTAVGEILKLKNTKNLNVVLSDHKPMSQPVYWQSLYNSKICVSPWGFGAYNWRDYEAIYLGALLIKPDTDFLESYCDLFRSGVNYIACNHDFSNLQEIMEECLGNFASYARVMENAIKTLNDHNNKKRIAKRFARQIMECLEA